MNSKMLVKDFKKNKVVTIILILFLVFSAALLSIGAYTILHLRGAMDELFEVAMPPHFLQMHTGDIDKQKVLDFGKKVPYVKEQEIVEMLNISGGNFGYEKGNGEYISISDNSMDNGFVVQNSHLDYLVDLDNKIISVNEGEIGVPLSYQKTYNVQKGDTLVIQNKDFKKSFKIACFVRDAQMGASMASSTRFVVTKEDWSELQANIGDLEYIMEYRFEDEKYASQFQKEYTDKSANMPVNGQAITYPLILLINGLSGGLLAGTLVLVSILLIVIAIMNLRSMMLTTLEEDRKEIAIMRAIGFSKKDVRDHYLVKYRILVVIGCIIGAIVAVPFYGTLTKDITLMFGPSHLSTLQMYLPVLATLPVYAFTLLACRSVLKKMGKITIVENMVYDGEKQKKGRAVKIKNSGRNLNVSISLKKIWLQMKSWKMVIVVFMLVTCIIVIPVNILHTFESKDFISYMGEADCDIGVNINGRRTTPEKVKELMEELQNDNAIEKMALYETYQYEVQSEDDGLKPFKVDCGDYSEFPISCSEGRMPKSEKEIAVSALNAKEYKVGVNDKLSLKMNDEWKEFVICGIYQDITSGGFTAKGMWKQDGLSTENSSACINLKDKEKKDKFVKEYEKKYPFAKIVIMENTVQQSLGTMILSFRGGTVVAVVTAVCIAILLTVLFLKLQTTRELPQTAIYQAIGFTEKEIRLQYVLQMGVTAAIGILLGLILSATLGESAVGVLLSILGIKIEHFHFIWDYIITFLASPVLLLAETALAAWLCQKRKENVSLLSFMRE